MSAPVKAPPAPIRKSKYANTTERPIKETPEPAKVRLGYSDIFNKECKPDLDKLREHFLLEGRLQDEAVLQIIEQVTEIFKKEPNLLDIDAPVTICGDVHGQYYDLVKLFEVGGPLASTTYLFLGDYVDRGNFSCECVLYLYCCKLLHPRSFYMVRGNHECRHLTDYFTFKEECKHKYSLPIYDEIMNSFDFLPLGALVNDQFLCIHGGISPDVTSLDDIRCIDRVCEPPSSGAMCDILWADPMEEFSADSDEYFEFNEVRGCSYMFSYKAVCNFLDRNGLLSIIRAHEAQDAGYRMHLRNEATGFPTVITMFSAPNYLDAYNNKGAVLRYENNVMNIRQFNHSAHPYWLPNFMDVFTWSVPFVVEKIAEMLLVFLNMCDDEQDDEDLLDFMNARSLAVDDSAEARKEAVKAKVRAVSKMMVFMKKLREERETVMKIKSFAPGSKLPAGLLSKGADALNHALGNFQQARDADRINEMRPPSPPESPRVEMRVVRTPSGRDVLVSRPSVPRKKVIPPIIEEPKV